MSGEMVTPEGLLAQTVDMLQVSATIGAALESLFPENRMADADVYGALTVMKDGVVFGTFRTVDEWFEFIPGVSIEQLDFDDDEELV